MDDCFYQSNSSLKASSHSFVWVEHDSDCWSHSLWWEVLEETSSNSTVVTVSVDNLSPSGSISSIVDSVSSFIDVANSSSEIESGTSLILAVLNCEESLAWHLRSLASSESSEDSFLIKSHRLTLVINLLLGRLGFLCHSSFF